MRFRAERAKRHRLGAETLDDGLERLNFIEGDGCVWNGVEQIAQENRTLVLRQLFKRRVSLRAGCAHMGVKTANNLGRTGVKFGSFAEAVQTGVGQFIGFAGEGGFVQAEIIREEVIERFLAGIISGVFKEFGAEIFGETYDLKEMAVAIASERGNAHAGKNFSQD